MGKRLGNSKRGFLVVKRNSCIFFFFFGETEIVVFEGGAKRKSQGLGCFSRAPNSDP